MLFRVSVLLLIALMAATAQAKDTELKTDKQRLSYAIGVQIGGSLQRDNMDVDGALVGQAIADVLANAELRLSAEDMQATFAAFQEAKMKEMQAIADVNLKAGQAFSDKFAKEKGVKTLESGIRYKVLTMGSGAKPEATDTVVVHYRGTKVDGTEFDSSYARGEPATFGVNAVIQGWQEILPMMPTGSKWHVVIPSTLAYGAQGTGGPIGPNDTLVFDIELLEIKKPAK